MVETKQTQPAGQEVGKVTHYFDKLGVGIIELTDSLKVGDKIAIRGNTTDIEQSVESMELDYKKVKEARKGEAIGLAVKDKVRPGDKVYRL